MYLVRSSQPPKSRFRDTSSAISPIYTVRLQAWNCSCAAFAFGGFPAAASGAKPWEPSEEDEEDVEMDLDRMEKNGENDWEFGGLSFDENVPVCKHLLACLLGERWEGVLGPYFKEREVGRDEMAGLAAE